MSWFVINTKNVCGGLNGEWEPNHSLLITGFPTAESLPLKKTILSQKLITT